MSFCNPVHQWQKCHHCWRRVIRMRSSVDRSAITFCMSAHDMSESKVLAKSSGIGTGVVEDTRRGSCAGADVVEELETKPVTLWGWGVECRLRLSGSGVEAAVLEFVRWSTSEICFLKKSFSFMRMSFSFMRSSHCAAAAAASLSVPICSSSLFTPSWSLPVIFTVVDHICTAVLETVAPKLQRLR